MEKKEIMTEVIRLGNDFAIPLPLTFCEGTTLEEGTELKIIYNDRGNLEVQVNRVIGKESTCELCGKRTAKYQCSNCGVMACSTDFWEWGGLCNNCSKH
jgi:antitoxin component of MazEF toxin-antitoxin module